MARYDDLIKKYENPRTGFKAEAFIDENGQKVL